MKLPLYLPSFGFSAGLFLLCPAPAPQVGGHPQEAQCDYVLVPQFDPGGCVSSGDPSCDGISPPCCRHFHLPLGWNKAVHWIKPTGQWKGPSIKKYYMATASGCTNEVCVTGLPTTDYAHFVWEDTLVGCML